MTKKEKKKEYQREYYIKNRRKIKEREKAQYTANREEILKRQKEYYVGNRDEILEQQKIKRAEKPWITHYNNAKRRCADPNDISFRYYGGRGIKPLLTIDEMEFLYKWYNAEDMERPSIDRIDNDGNYEFSNCRFIEQSENTRRAHKGRKRNA